MMFSLFSDVLCEDSLLGIDFDNCEDINLDSDVKDPSVLLLWKIQQVRISTYEQSNGFKITEKILHLVDTKVELEATCHLRDDWSRMEVEAEDLAYVSGLCFLMVRFWIPFFLCFLLKSCLLFFKKNNFKI